MDFVENKPDFLRLKMEFQPKISALLIEDDVALFQIWRLILKGLSFNVDLTWVCSSGAAKSQFANKTSKGTMFDLVIADVFISGGETGIDLWERFRENVGVFVFSSGITYDRFQALFPPKLARPMLIPKPANPLTAIEILDEALRSLRLKQANP